MKYSDYLKTDYWHTVAAEVKKRDGYRCVSCNRETGLVAHHRTYEHRGDELNHLGDVYTFCNVCHEEFHKIKNGMATVLPDMPEPPLSKRERKARLKARNTELSQARDIRHQFHVNQRAGYDALVNKNRQIIASLYDHEVDMPKAFPFTITRGFMQTIKTKAGGYTSKTISAIGVPIPPPAGWPSEVLGTTLTEEQCRAALVGRECRATLKTLRRRERSQQTQK